MRVFVYEKDDGGRVHLDLDHVLAIAIDKKVVREGVPMPALGIVNIYEEKATLVMAFMDKPMELCFRYAKDREGRKIDHAGKESKRVDRFENLVRAWKGGL
ncbi:hypothetical protein D3C87_1288860 [compost metagenome]